MKGTVHRCIDFQIRRFEPLYKRTYTSRPGSDRNGTRLERSRTFVRAGFLCDVCGFHSAERAGQVPRHSDAERLLMAFAVNDSETLNELKELAQEFGLEVQLTTTEFQVEEDK